MNQTISQQMPIQIKMSQENYYVGMFSPEGTAGHVFDTEPEAERYFTIAKVILFRKFGRYLKQCDIGVMLLKGGDKVKEINTKTMSQKEKDQAYRAALKEKIPVGEGHGQKGEKAQVQ